MKNEKELVAKVEAAGTQPGALYIGILLWVSCECVKSGEHCNIDITMQN